MQNTQYLTTLFLFFIPFTLFSQQNKPNILLIIADDLGIDVTNGYQQNDRMPVTPNLDAIRENGVTFTNTWAAPQCTPSRASIMSGKYGIKTGVMRPPGNLDLIHQSIFSRINETTNNAYATALIGKWHISSPANFDHPMEHGIDHYEGLINSSVDDYYSWDKVVDGMLTTSEQYVTTDLTNAAIDWVSNQDSPWFLWLAHVAPHGPFHLPPDSLHNVANTNDNLGKYLAAIEAMDHEIGRLLNSMDEQTRENTVIIFLGDNGTPGAVIQNFPGNHAKASMYEGGVRVPLFISGKGVSRVNETDNNLNHVADLYSTILELTGEQVTGGVYNSMSLKPLLSCDIDLERPYIYTDYEDGNVLTWAIRDHDYKLIEDENGNIEFYKISEDLLEETDLIGNLTGAEQAILTAMQAEVAIIRSGWSCNDGIQNGDETILDDCDDTCTANNSISTTNIGCCEEPDQPSVYYEYIEGNLRKIYTNNFPDHDYCYNSVNQIPQQTYHDFGVGLNPMLTNEITYVVRDNGRPARYFGVAKNGVIFAPAPAQPFIFEDQNTGEFNWDWVYEPTNNQGQGQDLVGLDCASAHTGGQGYHYHGNMFAYVENEIPGISTTSIIPTTPMHIGWAADGFPILYRFGPDADGNLKELLPSYQLKRGLRPGDDITEPCGPYNGKYTRDYEYICGKGDLDECNGIESSITLSTANGIETFEYFYVISSSFPQIPRCLKGAVSEDFDNGNDPLTGVDNDNDGFISQFDCDDENPEINPLAEEIPGNDIDENCDGDFTTSVFDLVADQIIVSPNPADGAFNIQMPNNDLITVTIFSTDGKLVSTTSGAGVIEIHDLTSGLYILQISLRNGEHIFKKQVIR